MRSFPSEGLTPLKKISLPNWSENLVLMGPLLGASSVDFYEHPRREVCNAIAYSYAALSLIWASVAGVSMMLT